MTTPRIGSETGNVQFPQQNDAPQNVEQPNQQTNSIWTKYDVGGGNSVANDGIIQEEELNNFINDKSNELGMNKGDTNLRVGYEFKKLANSFIGQRWQNCITTLENIARQAVNNIRGQIAAETDKEATMVSTAGTSLKAETYDVGGGNSVQGDGIIQEEELLNFINERSNALGMNRDDNNKAVGEAFIKMAGGFVGENWQNSLANLEDIARIAVNDVRGQVEFGDGSEDPTQVPRE